MERILDSEIAVDEKPAEHALRPGYLDEFIGQSGCKKNLSIFIESAKKRKDSLDHCLLYGPPGLGKTTMAQIISKEMGTNFKASSGPLLSKAGDLAAILTNIEEGDVLFIDEIHRLNPAVEEVLYPAMEDFTLDIIIGEGPAARTMRIDLPKFTLVGATTRQGMVSNPLRDRFGIPIRMEFYNSDELVKIILRGAKLLKTEISNDGAYEIASRSRGTPRIAIRLLRRVRDVALIDGDNSGKINKEIADKALKMMEVDNIGLDSADRRYLKYILDNFEGGPVGVETIAAGLSESRDTIEDIIEPYLLQIGFIQRTPRGRIISIKGRSHGLG